MRKGYDVVVVGAGILGLATAFHILRGRRDIELLMVDRLGGAGRGNTAKSAAAYRDMFTSPINRQLASGSIAFYEDIQERTGKVGLRRVGYLWLMTEEKFGRNREALEYMASAKVVFETLEPNELRRHLPDLVPGDICKGILGSRCGILNQNHLSGYYEAEIARMGGEMAFGTQVEAVDGENGTVTMKEGAVKAGTVVVATGAWMGELVPGIPVVPKKRQLFSIRAKGVVTKRLLNAKGLNSHDLLPFTIFPGGAYLRPAANSLIAGFSDEDRGPGLGEGARAEEGFFLDRVRPQLTKYIPDLGDVVPEHSWAGFYAYNPPDNLPFVDKVDGAIVVGGASGSGVMKADALGRAAAGLWDDRVEVELGDGSFLKVPRLALKDRTHPPEEFVI